jgi:hypothetical protein
MVDSDSCVDIENYLLSHTFQCNNPIPPYFTPALSNDALTKPDIDI